MVILGLVGLLTAVLLLSLDPRGAPPAPPLGPDEPASATEATPEARSRSPEFATGAAGHAKPAATESRREDVPATESWAEPDSVFGTVVGRDGKPVEAEVWILTADGSRYDYDTTEEDGRFEFMMREHERGRDWVLRAGNAIEGVSVPTPARAGTATRVQLTVPHATLRGRALHPSGEPAALLDLQFALRAPPEDEKIWHDDLLDHGWPEVVLRTDRNGRFEALAMRAGLGSYHVSCSFGLIELELQHEIRADGAEALVTVPAPRLVVELSDALGTLGEALEESVWEHTAEQAVVWRGEAAHRAARAFDPNRPLSEELVELGEDLELDRDTRCEAWLPLLPPDAPPTFLVFEVDHIERRSARVSTWLEPGRFAYHYSLQLEALTETQGFGFEITTPPGYAIADCELILSTDGPLPVVTETERTFASTPGTTPGLFRSPVVPLSPMRYSCLIRPRPVDPLHAIDTAFCEFELRPGQTHIERIVGQPIPTIDLLLVRDSGSSDPEVPPHEDSQFRLQWSSETSSGHSDWICISRDDWNPELGLMDARPGDRFATSTGIAQRAATLVICTNADPVATLDTRLEPGPNELRLVVDAANRPLRLEPR